MTTTNNGKHTDPPKLFTFVGTAFLTILKNFNTLLRGVYIIIDAESELKKLELEDDEDHAFILLPIAPRLAQEFMAKFGTKIQSDLLNMLPNVSTQHGMAQLRAIGIAVVKAVLESIGFACLFNSRVLPELRRMAGGELKCVSHIHFSGTSGGMGSGGGIVLTREIQRQFVNETDPEIESKIILIGALTYCSPEFPRTTENTSAAMVEWIYCVKNRVSLRASTTLVVHELRPLDTDTETRNGLLVDIFVSMHADRYVEDELRNRPNMAVMGDVGGTNLIRSFHYAGLDKRRVAANCAYEYRPFIRAILDEKHDVGSVKRVRFVARHRPTKRENIESIMQDVNSLDRGSVIAATVAPARKYRFAVRIGLTDGTTLDLKSVKVTFGSPIVNVVDAMTRMRGYRTCTEACYRRIEEIQEMLDELEESFEWMMNDAHKAVRNLQLGWMGWMLAGFKEFVYRTDLTESTLKMLRAQSDKLQELCAQINGLWSAIADLEREENMLASKLKVLQKQLDSCLPHGDEKRDMKLVEPLPISVVLPDLLRFVESNTRTKERFVDLLASSVQSVTVEGLAEIAGCEPSFDAIVASVSALENVQIENPAWGGEPQLSKNERYLILPPVNEQLRAKIEAHADNVHRRQFTFARVVTTTPNIVCIERAYAEKIKHVVTPFYESGVRRALVSDLAPLFVVNEEAFKELGYALPNSISNQSQSKES